MKYLLFIFLLNFAMAKSNPTEIYSELNNKITNLEHQNIILTKEIKHIKENFTIKLDVEKELSKIVIKNNIKEFDYLMNQQAENHKQELEYQKDFFWIFITIVSVIAFLVAWIGIEYMKKKIISFIKDNHYNETKKLVDSLANNKDFIKIMRAELDNINLENEDKKDVEKQLS